jgi:N-acetylmuramoyl-L-alanine amidase
MQKTGPAAGPVFDVRIPSGVFSFALGNRNARWNGVLVGLGYAPKMLAGRLQVHSLDLEKNLAPLLDPAPPPPAKGRLIVIDPGHGGANGGAQSVHNGRRESELTLDWARRLQAMLETNGWQVVLTRTNDVELDLPARVAVADRVDADLFVSLHFNTAAPDPAPVGLETYCLTPAGLPSNLTRGYADPVWRTLPNNAFDTSNVQCAARIHRALVSTTGAVDRGVRRARFMDVLGPQRRAAVLVEGGFLSSPREARLVADADYRQKLARAMATAIGPAAAPPISPDQLATPAREPESEAHAAGK